MQMAAFSLRGAAQRPKPRQERGASERGLWEFPDGSVEFGETLAEALKREMRELTQITRENLLNFRRIK